jgi:hypothetical protein
VKLPALLLGQMVFRPSPWSLLLFAPLRSRTSRRQMVVGIAEVRSQRYGSRKQPFRHVKRALFAHGR